MVAGYLAPTLILERSTLSGKFCLRCSRIGHFGREAGRIAEVDLARKFEALMIGKLVWIVARPVAPSVFEGTRPMDSVVGCKFVDLMVEGKWNHIAWPQRSFSDRTKRHCRTDNWEWYWFLFGSFEAVAATPNFGYSTNFFDITHSKGGSNS